MRDSPGGEPAQGQALEPLPRGERIEKFEPTSGRWLGWVAVAVAGLLALDVIRDGISDEDAVSLAVLLLSATIVYMVMVRPRVVAYENVLTVKNIFEIGRALNPKMVEQQLVGGSWMGISHALYETTEPYYPNRDHGGTDFNQYLMPGPGDVAETEIIVLERPSSDGPYGAKGAGEMCANPQIPAIANAIFDAVGVRIDTLPMTPERILRALKAQRAAG